MGKYPVYAIVALIFIGVIKLLQVTAFDAEKYSKNRKTTFSKDIYKPSKKETESSSSKTASQLQAETPPPVLDRTEGDSLETDTFEPADETDDKTENNAFEEKTEASESSATNKLTPARSYNGLAELKNLYLAPKIANLPPGQLRQDVVIRYYRHDQDGDKVYSLKALGYYIHEKEATETEGLGSNVMYYGESVAIEDIQIVAYTLLENGIPLKSIKQSSYSWKANAIEIGTDPDILDQSDLTAEDIAGFRK